MMSEEPIIAELERALRNQTFNFKTETYVKDEVQLISTCYETFKKEPNKVNRDALLFSLDSLKRSDYLGNCGFNFPDIESDIKKLSFR